MKSFLLLLLLIRSSLVLSLLLLLLLLVMWISSVTVVRGDDDEDALECGERLPFLRASSSLTLRALFVSMLRSSWMRRCLSSWRSSVRSTPVVRSTTWRRGGEDEVLRGERAPSLPWEPGDLEVESEKYDVQRIVCKKFLSFSIVAQ